jgi:hypothetical protein
VESETNNFDKQRKLISKYEDFYEISALVLKIISIRNTNFFVTSYPPDISVSTRRKVTTSLRFKTMSLSSSSSSAALLLFYQFMRLTRLRVLEG